MNVNVLKLTILGVQRLTSENSRSLFNLGYVKVQTKGHWMLEHVSLPKNVEIRAAPQQGIVPLDLEFVANSRKIFRSYFLCIKLFSWHVIFLVAGQVLVDPMSRKIALLYKMTAFLPHLCKPPLANIMCKTKIQVMQIIYFQHSVVIKLCFYIQLFVS